MIKPDNESRLVDFYKTANLPSEKMDTILAAGEQLIRIRRIKRILWLLLMALTIVSVAVGGYIYVRMNVTADANGDPSLTQAPAIQLPTPNSDDSAAEGSPATSAGSKAEVSNDIPRFGFIAIRSHGDGCPLCKATKDRYQQAVRGLQHLPIDFELLQLNDPVSSDATKQRIAQLRLSPQILDEADSGVALLLSPRGNKIRKFLSTDDPDVVVQQIRDAVEQ